VIVAVQDLDANFGVVRINVGGRGCMAMSYVLSSTGAGIVGVAALMLGAMQLAPGQDLTGSLKTLAGISDQGVNRAVKSDRVVGLTPPAAPTQTISIKLDGLADTLILVRVPPARDARNTQPTTGGPIRSGAQSHAIACEPVVSVLTDIAKWLQPGRCIT